MDSHGVFSFLKILKEAAQLLPKNGKLMALVALFSFLLSAITFVAFAFSILGLLMDMAFAAASLVDPSKLEDQIDHMKHIVAIIYTVEIAFIFVFLVISFFTTMATVLVAAVSHVGTTLSLRDLLSRIAGTWTKPFLTSFYVSVHAIGFLAIAVLFAVPAFIYPNIVTTLIAVSFALAVFLFYLYFLVIWTLAIVVSVVEKGCYGMVAMGKASELVKGQRLKGYMLNLSFFLVSLILSVIYHLIWVKRPSSAIIYGLFMVGFSYLMKILQLVAYTVLYFHSKKQHGEIPEIDIGAVKYELLPTTYS